MDIAVAGVGASVVLDAARQSFVSARIALASVGPTPIFAAEAGALLAGKPVGEDAIQLAADDAQAAARPITDMRGTVEQRKHLIKVLTARALRGAVERAKGA
jgi:carbon-monoxide dehydrogenase medium subunit